MGITLLMVMLYLFSRLSGDVLVILIEGAPLVGKSTVRDILLKHDTIVASGNKEIRSCFQWNYTMGEIEKRVKSVVKKIQKDKRIVLVILTNTNKGSLTERAEKCNRLDELEEAIRMNMLYAVLFNRINSVNVISTYNKDVEQVVNEILTLDSKKEVV